MAKRKLATLLTDFGLQDPYVAAMKGVLLGVCPGVRIVDISHDVPAHDVLAGAFVLAQAAPYFPPETLHIIVVDPGVGTGRSILAARLGGQSFLFPDNGIISLVSQVMPLEVIVAVRDAHFLLRGARPSTFQGRDVFAPLAGQILNGLDIRKLGPRPDTYKVFDLPTPDEKDDRIVGEVIFVDHFGNLVSNIPMAMVCRRWREMANLRVMCAGRNVSPLRGAYGFVMPGELLALFNSMDFLEVAVNHGRACDVLAAGLGTQVCVEQETDG